MFTLSTEMISCRKDTKSINGINIIDKAAKCKMDLPLGGLRDGVGMKAIALPRSASDNIVGTMCYS
jgi:hypothetical protein